MIAHLITKFKHVSKNKHTSQKQVTEILNQLFTKFKRISGLNKCILSYNYFVTYHKLKILSILNHK